MTDWKAYLIACHNSSIHISMAIVDAEYLDGITQDNLREDKFLVLKRGQKWDLMDPEQRMQGCREILSLLRYLTRWKGGVLRIYKIVHYAEII